MEPGQRAGGGGNPGEKHCDLTLLLLTVTSASRDTLSRHEGGKGHFPGPSPAGPLPLLPEYVLRPARGWWAFSTACSAEPHPPQPQVSTAGRQTCRQHQGTDYEQEWPQGMSGLNPLL